MELACLASSDYLFFGLAWILVINLNMRFLDDGLILSYFGMWIGERERE